MKSSDANIVHLHINSGRGSDAGNKNPRWRWILYAVSLPLALHILLQSRMMLPDYAKLVNVYESGFSLASQPCDTTIVSSFTGTSIDRTSPFCQRWLSSDALNRTLQPFDNWHTHHPNWIVTNETDDMFCVEPGDRNNPHIRDFMKFYTNQFYSSCEKIHAREMWSSGWGADWSNIQSALVMATEDFGVPIIIKVDPEYPWHYVANKNDSSARTCPAGDPTCYFLPYQGCGSLDELENSGKDIEFDIPLDLDRGGIGEEIGRSAYFFLTRKQLWLRRAVFDYKEQFKRKYAEQGGTDCTVMHVRRSDIVLHFEHSRRYYPVADYVKLIPDVKRNNPIFLLTDDSNAIKEAHEFFPDLKWRYFDRPRHKGSSGGWENQTPSRNPALEVIVLLATFELAQECSTMVHGHSNFADYIWQQMKLSNQYVGLKRLKKKRYRVDGSKVHDASYNASEAELEKLLQEMKLKNSTFLPDSTTPYPSIADSFHQLHHCESELERKKCKSTSGCEWRRRKCVDASSGTVLYQHLNLTTFLQSNNRLEQDHKVNCSSTKGIIIVNVLGLLANDLFEAAFAKRIATQLGCGWHVIYRTKWNAAFPNERTDKCFPNALADNSNRRPNYAKDRTMEAIQIVNESSGNRTSLEPNLLYQALIYNGLEPEKNGGFDISEDQANEIVGQWVQSLGEAALEVAHLEYPLQKNNVDQLVSKLKDPSSPIRVVNLDAFFIHFDWMNDWMDQISNWLQIDPSCCTATAPSADVTIHIRDFEEGDEFDMKDKFNVGVYRDLINRYSNKAAEVVIVCQPKSVESDIVKALVKEFNASVRTGNDNIDAFCLLSRARGMMVLSTTSTFGQMAALLAQGENRNLQVHYPTHTLRYPKVTLKVPGWKYHLANQSQIVEYDVDHERLKVSQA